MRSFLTFPTVAGFIAQFSLSAAISCRCLPRDECWPQTSQWQSLNASVGGRLVASSPLGKPCHDPTYNATECATLQSEWLFPQLQCVHLPHPLPRVQVLTTLLACRHLPPLWHRSSQTKAAIPGNQPLSPVLLVIMSSMQ